MVKEFSGASYPSLKRRVRLKTGIGLALQSLKKVEPYRRTDSATSLHRQKVYKNAVNRRKMTAQQRGPSTVLVKELGY